MTRAKARELARREQRGLPWDMEGMVVRARKRPIGVSLRRMVSQSVVCVTVNEAAHAPAAYLAAAVQGTRDNIMVFGGLGLGCLWR